MIILHPDLAEALGRFGWGLISALVLSALVDVVVCVALCYYLRRNMTAFRRYVLVWPQGLNGTYKNAMQDKEGHRAIDRTCNRYDIFGLAFC